MISTLQSTTRRHSSVNLSIATDMTPVEEALFDVRNGVVGHNCSTRGLREARALKLVKFDHNFGVIRLTVAGWVRMHAIEAWLATQTPRTRAAWATNRAPIRGPLSDRKTK